MSQITKRNKIETLWNTGLHNPKQISNALDVSLNTVYRVIRRISEHKSLDHRPGACRPAIVYRSIRRSVVVKLVSVDPKISIREIASKLPCTGSKTSVHRCLQRLEYSKPLPIKVPMLSETNRLKRIEWARTNIDKPWNQAVLLTRRPFGYLEGL